MLKTRAGSEDRPEREIEPDAPWLAMTLGYLKSVYEQGELTDGVLGLATTVLRGIEVDELPNPSLRVSEKGSFNVRWFQGCGCILGLTFINADTMRFSARFHDGGNGKPGREGPIYIGSNRIAEMRELVADFHGASFHKKRVLLSDAMKGGLKC